MFQLLRDGKPRTRSELAVLTGQARSTIATRIDILEQLGLIASVGEASSTGGRPPATFAFNPLARVVIGVDLGAAHARIAITDLSASVIEIHDESLHIADGPKVVLDRVVEICHNLLARSGRAVSDLAAIGLGVPGPVEHSTGRPIAPPIMPGWDGFDVPGYVGRHFNVPVLVDNDVNLMAVGEYRTAWEDHDNMLFIKVATGIGSGIILDGALRRGAQGAAGDIGHIVLSDHSDVPCDCGNFGCLEAVAGGAAVARALEGTVKVPAGASLAAQGATAVVDAVREGSIEARTAVRDAGRSIGTVAAACVSMLNPSLIVVGGALVGAGEQLMAGMRESLYQRSLPLATQHLRVVTSQAKERAGILGGAYLAIDHVLSAEAIDAMNE